MGWGIGLVLVLIGFAIMVLNAIPGLRDRLPARCTQVDGHMMGFHVLGAGAMLSSVLWMMEASGDLSPLVKTHVVACMGWAALSLLMGTGTIRGYPPSPDCRFSGWPLRYRLFLYVGVVSILITTGLSL